VLPDSFSARRGLGVAAELLLQNAIRGWQETSSPKFLHPEALGLDTVIPRNRNQQKETPMSKSKPAQRSTQDANHHANQLNPNYGTNGTNPANGHVHGNRSKQISQRKK